MYYFLTYVSSAVRPFDKADLLALLEKARSNNSSRGITGILLYKEGNFMQVLEGERDAVLQRFDVIRQDRRHSRVIELDQGPTAERMFADWSMAFRDLSDAALMQLPGFSRFMNTSLQVSDPKSDHHMLWQLLEMFRGLR